jgi:hypothetical protein
MKMSLNVLHSISLFSPLTESDAVQWISRVHQIVLSSITTPITSVSTRLDGAPHNSAQWVPIIHRILEVLR